MKIYFAGDRRSKTIAIGYGLRKIFGKELIKIDLWDGYKSKFYITNGKGDLIWQI